MISIDATIDMHMNSKCDIDYKNKMVKILHIQRTQVDRWFNILNDRCSNILYNKIEEENYKLDLNSKPTDVFRGDDIANFITNIKPKIISRATGSKIN